MRVEVLERHIETGTPCVEEHCPIALAILEVLRSEVFLMGVYVSAEDVFVIYADGSEKVFQLPLAVSEIVDHYDNTGEMYPFGFEL